MKIYGYMIDAMECTPNVAEMWYKCKNDLGAGFGEWSHTPKRLNEYQLCTLLGSLLKTMSDIRSLGDSCHMMYICMMSNTSILNTNGISGSFVFNPSRKNSTSRMD